MIVSTEIYPPHIQIQYRVRGILRSSTNLRKKKRGRDYWTDSVEGRPSAVGSKLPTERALTEGSRVFSVNSFIRENPYQSVSIPACVPKALPPSLTLRRTGRQAGVVCFSLEVLQEPLVRSGAHAAPSQPRLSGYVRAAFRKYFCCGFRSCRNSRQVYQQSAFWKDLRRGDGVLPSPAG